MPKKKTVPKKKTTPKSELQVKFRFKLAAPCPRCRKVFDEKDTVGGIISLFTGPYHIDGALYQTLENVCIKCHKCGQVRIVKIFHD